jgi:uncharacterized damage-inducible protein DinB
MAAYEFEALMRLIRLARHMESAGQYNFAKLFWGIAYAMEISHSNGQPIPIPADDVDGEINKVIEAIKSAGAGPDVLAALEIGRKAVGEKRSIGHEEIEGVNVCRTCGHLVLHDAPEQCPNCGAWELTFRTFPAVYYLEPLPPDQALEGLAMVPGAVERLLAGLSDEQMLWQSAPTEWNIREVLAHMLLSQELVNGRIRLMLNEDDPTIKAARPEDLSDPGSMSAPQILAKFSQSRTALVADLRAMPQTGWWRTGKHQEFGQVTILQQASYFAKHDHAHLTQIRTILNGLKKQ